MRNVHGTLGPFPETFQQIMILIRHLISKFSDEADLTYSFFLYLSQCSSCGYNCIH